MKVVQCTKQKEREECKRANKWLEKNTTIAKNYIKHIT